MKVRVRGACAGLFAWAACATSAHAAPLLSEVFYDAAGADDGQGFVELWGAPGTSLDGFVVEGINGANGAVTHTLLLGGVIGADGFFVVGDDRGDGQSDVAEVDQVLDFDFQNGPDGVVLRDASGVRDALGYGVFGAGTSFPGEGAPAPDAPSGASVARLFANVDSGDNALDFAVAATPTPGTGPLRPVPEPASATLLGAGLLWLASAGRRRA